MPSAAEVDFYETWARTCALRRHQELFPETKSKPYNDFFGNFGKPFKTNPPFKPAAGGHSCVPPVPVRNPKAMTVLSQAGGPRHYIVDSGASYHMVSREQLTPTEASNIAQLPKPIRIDTANGTVVVKEKALVYIEELDVQVWATLLSNTVAVLSLGLLCSEQLFSFHWVKDDTPYLEKDGNRVACHPNLNVPFV